jgi:hypothetical protein
VGPAAATNEIFTRANRFQAPVTSHETLRTQAVNVTFCASRHRFWSRYDWRFSGYIAMYYYHTALPQADLTLTVSISLENFAL